MQSSTIGELAKALALAQSEIQGAVKTAVNPHFHSKYANLEEVWNACRGPLTKNGLSIVQLPNIMELDGAPQWILTTTILHSSGEWISGDHPLICERPGPQSLKSAITYARRTALAGAAGVPEVDDGEDAEKGRKPREVAPGDKASKGEGVAVHLKALFATAASVGLTEEDMKLFVRANFPEVKSRKDLTTDQCKTLINILKNEQKSRDAQRSASRGT